MTKHEIIDEIADDIAIHQCRHRDSSIDKLGKKLFESYMDWIDIEEAPKDNFEPGLLLLSNNAIPFFPCFWVEDKQCWVRKVSFMDASGEPQTVFNVVKSPSHYRIIPPIP